MGPSLGPHPRPSGMAHLSRHHSHGWPWPPFRGNRFQHRCLLLDRSLVSQSCADMLRPGVGVNSLSRSQLLGRTSSLSWLWEVIVQRLKLHACMHACLHACMHMHMHMHAYACMCMHLHAYAWCICICICICICAYACICICICRHMQAYAGRVFAHVSSSPSRLWLEGHLW